MKTIAQQLNIKDFPFIIKDFFGNQIYFERSSGSWNKYEYNSDHNVIYACNSKGFWIKSEYDSDHNVIYTCNSKGYITDNRPKQVILSMNDIAEKFGINIKDLKIKK